MNKIELMEYKKYKLGDICKIFGRIGFRGYTTEDLVLSPSYGAISLSPSNIIDGIMDLSKCTYISWAKYEESPEIKITPNDIVIVKTGNSYGRTAIIRNVEHPMTLNPQFVVLKDIQINPVYLAYFLKTDEFQKQIYGIVGGSAIPTLSQEDLASLIVRVPNENIQNTIADILDSLDGKIELNKLINDNLEAMAKQLYDYWFVQFDFPNEEGKPYKSSGGAMVWNDKLKREIPEGWYAENICKIANILSGGTPSKAVDEYWNNGTIPFFGPTDCNGSVFQIKTADHITQKGLEHCASSLFEEGIVIITARGSIGKLVIVGTPMAMNQSCYALQSKEGEYEYLYFLTTQLIDCLKAKGSGSVFKSIIASDIEHSTLCIATENVVSDFCKKVKPLFEKLKANTIEIAELTKQRDELLPLLMNGQASVNSD
jgi:type I restriction enzyme S subunit